MTTRKTIVLSIAIGLYGIGAMYGVGAIVWYQRHGVEANGENHGDGELMGWSVHSTESGMIDGPYLLWYVDSGALGVMGSVADEEAEVTFWNRDGTVRGQIDERTGEYWGELEDWAEGRDLQRIARPDEAWWGVCDHPGVPSPWKVEGIDGEEWHLLHRERVPWSEVRRVVGPAPWRGVSPW